MQQIKCSKCGSEITPGQRFCGNCGASLCPHCNIAVPPGSTECPTCGYLLGTVHLESETAPPPTPLQRPPSSEPKAPIPQPRASSEYVGHQQPARVRDDSLPDAQPDSKTQQAVSPASKALGGPSPPMRLSKATIAIIVIVLLGIVGSVGFIIGWFEGPLGTIQEFVSRIEVPSVLPPTHRDTTPPEIKNASAEDITQTGAVIPWETDEPATSQVMICQPGGLCIWTERDEALVTSHSVSLSELEPNTVYHFTVVSSDDSGNEATYEGELMTLPVATQLPLVISGVSISNTTESSIAIRWETDKPATGQVEYGTTDAYGSTSPLDEKLAMSHSIILDGLESNTTYYFRVKSKDSSGNEATSETDQTFTTLSPPPIGHEGHEVGKHAPDFTLESIDGENISLSDFQGKIIMINFWAEGYIACRTELPHIQAVYDTWSGQELVILAVNQGESTTNVSSYVENSGLTFTILLDPLGQVAKLYDVSSTPTSFFIDTQGTIQEIKARPFRNPGEIKSILDSL